MWPTLNLLLLAALIALHFWWRKRLLSVQNAFEKELGETHERQSQQNSDAAAKQTALFNSMVEGVLALDKRNRIRLANEAIRDLFHLPDDIQGKTIMEAFRLIELDEIVNRLPQEKHILDVELTLPGLEKRVVQVNASAAFNPGGEHVGAILVFHDLTRLKKLENTRQEFVANVSHELRTPLSLIKGYVETLIDGAKDDPEVATKFLQTIDKHADRLTFLIEDLLTISQFESGQIALNLQNVNLHELVEGIVNDLQSRANDKKIQLTNAVPSEICVHADADRVGQVLFNLVDNAIKHGRKNGFVKIDARPGEEQRIEVRVQDDGPGIPPEAQQRVFERFYRVDKARSREAGGTGLGLSIVKHIVQSHGGKVWVTGETGSGSTFYFTVPMPKAN
jgi:two-component system, OmpR family, phosphate regulon sensor histidine kinase PhoR